MSYIIIKVGLLVVIEICIFPLICGIWLDVCSLKIFNSTTAERINNFQMTSGTSVFIHWLIGMVYVFYFATSVFLLREVLRPGVLWFLRNLNDPDFNPIQEVTFNSSNFLSPSLLSLTSFSFFVFAADDSTTGSASYKTFHYVRYTFWFLNCFDAILANSIYYIRVNFIFSIQCIELERNSCK